jgi:hypothetical protein
MSLYPALAQRQHALAHIEDTVLPAVCCPWPRAVALTVMPAIRHPTPQYHFCSSRHLDIGTLHSALRFA